MNRTISIVRRYIAVVGIGKGGLWSIGFTSKIHWKQVFYVLRKGLEKEESVLPFFWGGGDFRPLCCLYDVASLLRFC